MTQPRDRRRLALIRAPGAARAVALGVAGLFVTLGLAAAQDVEAPGDWDDPRPPVAAYVIVDAVGVEAPLGGEKGDAARGLALFADPETGGCISCHAAPGLERLAVAPRILRDRVDAAPPPDPATDPDTDAPAEAEPPSPPASDSDSRLAPRAALLAVPRPTDLTAEEAGPGQDEADADIAGGAAPPQGEPAPQVPPPPVYPGDDEPDRPRLLPLPAGPDLAGVASRLPTAALRLWVIDPRAFGAGQVMPGYHAVSESLGRRRPSYRQPWFSPAQVEDMVAYLETLTAAE